MVTLFVSYSGHFGGAERVLLDCAAGLDGQRVLACPEGPLEERASAAGLRVLPIRERSLQLRGSAREPAAAALRLAAHSREVRRLARSLRPDVLVAWGMRSALATAAGVGRASRPPVLVFQHNDLLPAGPAARAVRAAAGRFDRVIALSRAVASDLDPHGALSERVRVCHPGVDLERFPALPTADAGCEVLLLGAIVDWKRPELALEAIAAAAPSLPGLRLRVAGAPLDDGGERLLVRLRERAARPDLAGRVELAGALDAGAALRSAGCLLHCADSEPFGLVVLEALASARPVVAPAAGGPAELLDDEVGRLYPPGDAEAAGAALVELLRDPQVAAGLGAAARRRAEQRHGMAEARRNWREALGTPPEAEARRPGG